MRSDLPIVLLGDFNLPEVNWCTYACPSGQIYSEFMQVIQAHGLVQTVLEPTRNNSILDLVFCSDELSITAVQVEPSFGQSDHSAVVFQLLSNQSQIGTEEQQYIRNFRKLDLITAKQLLSQVNWDALFRDCKNVQEMWNAFKCVMEQIFDQCVPWITVSSRKKRYPRFIAKLQAKKRRLYRTWKRLGCDSSKQAYRKCCRECTDAIRLQRVRQEERILNSGSRTQFYAYVNKQRAAKVGVAPLSRPDGSVAISDAEKAAVLGKQFSSVFTSDDGALPHVPRSTAEASLTNFVITVESVRKVLCKLELKYGNDPDGIPSAVLRLLSYELAKPLTIMFRESLATGQLPETWKLADIMPIFKKGPGNVPGNYRPVSITSSVCRVFERVLMEHLMFHLLSQKLISDQQFGFLKRRSTELQLLSCIEQWTKSLDEGLLTDIIYIDFAKAFDTVCHVKLVHKLEHAYGIGGSILAWIKSFLHGRQQRVKVGMAYSEYKPVMSGVPQGSVIGPVLFILYVNDIVECISPEVSLKMFADDIKLYMCYKYAYERVILQSNLHYLGKWSTSNQLVIQCCKCAVMYLGNSEPESYVINEQHVPNTKTMSDLGVLVDPTLSFSEHISKSVGKAYRSLAVLFKCFHTNDRSALTFAYATYVRPTLEYACAVWSPSLHRRSPLGCISSIDRLEAVQRSFTRRLFKRCRLPEMSYVNRLQYLNLESLELRRVKSCLCMVFKMLHGLVDVKSEDFFELSMSRTRGHSWKLRCPFFKKDVRQNFFSLSIIPIWNNLPGNVVDSASLACFKKRLSDCNDLLLKHCVFDRNL